MAIRKRQAFLSHNKTNDHYANYSLHILIFPQILGKFLYTILRSVTQTTYFSSGLEHRLNSSCIKGILILILWKFYVNFNFVYNV